MRLYQVPSERLEVVYSAADARFRSLPPAEAEALLAGIDVPRPFVLTVGTLEPRKNISRLVDAFLSLDVPHHLVVVGARGWLDGDLVAKLRHPRIVAPKNVSDDQLVGLYNLAESFVYPSLYEGFGLPALEAMSCGTPVAVSNVSSLPEVVGQAGLTFDPEDTAAIATCLHRLATTPTLSAELQSAGQEQAKKFSWRTSALQLKAIYESL
jgi:glycosyltransferase involved in cell wall biosynthesis